MVEYSRLAVTVNFQAVILVDQFDTQISSERERAF